MPARWTPGMRVQVDWQTGVGRSDDFPGLDDWSKVVEWADNVVAQQRSHSRSVPVPSYSEQSTCGITVHFLPCDEIQVA
uniref:DUF3304 domain-containing protein n=1 Tax=Pseudomonas huaxiensis TaxID=2213017 RepID=UPI001CDB5189